MKRISFTIIFLGMLVGCVTEPPEPEVNPVKILSIDLSPISGSPTICTAEIYARGTGRVEVEWFNRFDTTGEHRITSKYLLIDGEGAYESILDRTPNSLEYYYHVIICDSAGIKLKKSAEVFYGTGPAGAPVIKSLIASPYSGEAPLYVNFCLTLQQAYLTECWFDMGDGVGLRGPYLIEEEYTCGRPYDDPGTYTITAIVANQWGADTIIKLDMIYVW